MSELRQVGSYGSFASAWGYNSADGLAWRQYPGGNNGQLGELVSYSYDQRMQLTTATGDYAYVSASAYDAAGRLVQRSLGNAAVLSQYTYYPWEQQGGRLQQLLSGTPADSDSLQDLRYTYDLSGNLLSLQDYLAGSPQTQNFGYDALDRLVSAAASGGDSGLGDYSLEMAYDPGSGNLRQKGELYYRYLDSGHSHAVTAVSDGWRYEYDPNGNLVRKAYRPGLYFPLVLLTEPEETLGASPESQVEPTSPYPPPEAQSRAEPAGLLAWLHSAWDFIGRLFGGGQHTALAAGLQQAYPPPGDPTPTPDPSPPEPPEEVEYGYDAENRLVSVSAGEMAASFIYDGDGQRVASVIAGVATVYIGEVFEWDVTSSSMTRYYYAGTQRVAVRTGSAAPVWLLGDHLGSTSVAANTDGSLLSRQGYLPWGELRFAEGSLPGRYQFTGQASYEAEFGLYYYKARWYDPSLGRWASPDSVVPLATQGVQAWDRYAYVNNSPVNATDPTGHLACWDDNANDTGCEQYTPTGYGLLLENPSPSQGTPPTLTDKIRQGDTSALVQLLTPSHIGGRLQFEGSFILIIGVSVSVGVNGVYNRNSDELAANVDWAIEGGGGLGVGASGTGGALIGWGSSDIDDATKGFSGIISGTVAAEGAASAALTTPIDEKGFHVDPYSGQVPFTIYFGGGAGGGYAGIGGGVNGPTGIYVNLTRFLPWHWFK